MKAISLLFTIAVIFTACKTNKAQTAEASSDELTLLLSDNYGGPEEEGIMVYRSAAELNKFLIQVNKTRKPGLTAPKIDFDKNMVIVYCAGITNPGELNLKVKSEEEDYIDFMVERPDPEGTIAVTAIVMPFYIYSIPNTEKEIRLASE